GGKKGQVIIVPNSKTVALNVINAGTTLGTENYKVARVPKPRLEYSINGQVVNERTGAQASMARSISVKAIAEENFANYSPEDARFRVAEITVFLVRGSRPQGPPVNISGPSGSIAALASRAQAGDRLVVEVKSVQRQNFKGEVSDAGLNDSKNIPLN
ncbi:MAG: gliding motility protein GldM, partial [Runella slithyformis]